MDALIWIFFNFAIVTVTMWSWIDWFSWPHPRVHTLKYLNPRFHSVSLNGGWKGLIYRMCFSKSGFVKQRILWQFSILIHVHVKFYCFKYRQFWLEVAVHIFFHVPLKKKKNFMRCNNFLKKQRNTVHLNGIFKFRDEWPIPAKFIVDNVNEAIMAKNLLNIFFVWLCKTK